MMIVMESDNIYTFFIMCFRQKRIYFSGISLSRMHSECWCSDFQFHSPAYLILAAAVAPLTLEYDGTVCMYMELCEKSTSHA